MKGYTFHRTYFIICDRCNENIVERADELNVDTLDKAKEYAREHQNQHAYDDERDAE